MLRRSLREYVDHYHGEQNHQGIGKRTIMPRRTRDDATRTIRRRARLGGILNFRQLVAA